MSVQAPETTLAREFSSPDAKAGTWSTAQGKLEKAEIYWLATVRPEGRPHVTPLVGLWADGAFIFCTGRDERKAKNLERNTYVCVTTGCNSFESGVDVVVEGRAVPVTEQDRLRRLAEAFGAKYGPPFDFQAGDGTFINDEGGPAIVFEVSPVTAFGFDKGEQFSQTRWRF
jgi:hypothetical protein